MSDDVDPRDTPRHPRRRNSLLGHEKAENRLLQAYRSGRLHHAWLIGGPRGVGTDLSVSVPMLDSLHGARRA